MAKKNFHYVNDRAHAEMWRDMLLADAGSLDYVGASEWPEVSKRFRDIAKAAGAKSPTKREIRLGTWGPWAESVLKEVLNASDGEINRYGPKAYDIVTRQDCPICSLLDQERRR